MPENKQSALESYMLPKKIEETVRKETIETTLKQIGKGKLMERFYREQALKTEDPKEAGKYNLQADQIVEAQKINVEFMAWLEA